MSLPRIRTVPTGSGATAVQIIWRYKNNRPVLTQVGSAHTDAELALLKSKAQRLMLGDQLCLEFDNDPTKTLDAPLLVTAEHARVLLDVINHAYRTIGLDVATDNDTVFRDLVTARLVHPGSKLDAVETLEEIGITCASYATIRRNLPRYATRAFRDRLTQALAAHICLGPGVMVLYDVTTLYFETDSADELRKPGFSKERRLEPQITVGLLTDAAGFPLAVGCFEGNKAETCTLIPMIEKLQSTYQLDRVTVVADAGMFSESNKQALKQAGLDYILGVKLKDIPYPIQSWRTANPEARYADGQVWVHRNRGGAGPEATPVSVTFYQYSWDRARRSLKGIDEQVAKAEKAVAGKIAVKRNRYVNLKSPNKQVNYGLAEKHRALAGIKGYETSRVDLGAEQVIGAYRRLFKIEKAFRMAKSDLRARPIYHHKAESIEAHLTVVLAAVAVGHVLEQASGLSLKRLVRTLRKYRMFTVVAGGSEFQAQVPLPLEVQEMVDRLLGKT